MKGSMLNFDRFLAEQKSEYAEVKVLGKTYRVKKEVPALLPLTLVRAEESGEAGILGRAMLLAGDTLFGREAMDGFCRAGMSAQEVTALVEQTLEMICGGDQREREMDSETLSDEEGQEKPAKK